MTSTIARTAYFTAALVLALALAGCATANLALPVNQPQTAAAPNEQPTLAVEGDVVALSFSGGGARAAAFSLGVLQGLREMPRAGGGTLLDRVALVSGVSGGSITAAYFGQHGAAGVDRFRAAYLDKDWESDLHLSLASPLNWARAYDGALNERDRLGDWLDKEIFTGATLGDLWRPGHARTWINATDLYTGVPFAFVPAYFDALCSDHASVRVADAVAASMSVPVYFRPTVLASYADRCTKPLPAWVAKAQSDRQASELLRVTARAFAEYRDPARVRYVHLIDGGVADNFGLSNLILMRRAATTPFGPFTPRDAVRVRRLTFLVVNAEQGRDETWPLTPTGPDGPETLRTAMDNAVNVSKQRAYDAFRDMIAIWERDVRGYRCALPKAQAARLSAGLKNWNCRDVRFAVDMISFTDLPAPQGKTLAAVPTRVSLPPGTIDALIEGGKQAVKTNPAAQALRR
ncbi:MAG: patatin-like phospholipase family protein [Alphaproteobacteria bacterium]|nr:patatin-like phospholipase family protein [Alphaproteobacteria bacterium]